MGTNRGKRGEDKTCNQESAANMNARKEKIDACTRMAQKSSEDDLPIHC